jgi:hypothetical protein
MNLTGSNNGSNESQVLQILPVAGQTGTYDGTVPTVGRVTKIMRVYIPGTKFGRNGNIQ